MPADQTRHRRLPLAVTVVLCLSWANATAAKAFAQFKSQPSIRQILIQKARLNAAELRTPSAVANAKSQSLLQWRNGDALSGELVDLTLERLKWKSPQFAEPFSLDPSYLKAVRFAAPPSDSKTNESMQFVLRGGDVIFGELAGMSRTHVVIDSRRHGRCQILRSAVRNFESLTLDSGGGVESTSIEGWKTLRDGKQLTDWQTNAQGQLSTAVKGAELLRKAALPELSEIELAFRWQKTPRFVVAFPPSNSTSVESLKLLAEGNSLVLRQRWKREATKIKILSLSKDIHDIHLRLYWNQKTSELSVYSGRGDRLGAIKAGGNRASQQCRLYIYNAGTDLTLLRARVREWDGVEPKADAKGPSRISLTDGSMFYGRIQEFDKSRSEFLVVDQTGGSRRIPLDQITGVHLADMTRRRAKRSLAEIIYADGGHLQGTITGVKDGVIQLTTTFSEQPLATPLDGATELKFNPTENLPLPAGLLEFDNGRLRGQLTSSGSELGWRPAGSDNSSPLPANCRARINRRVNADEQSEKDRQDGGFRDAVYMRSGDVIPCRVESCDAEALHAQTPWSDTVRIERNLVKAIELDSNEPLPLSFGGFGGRWVVSELKKGAVDLSSERAVFRGAATLEHRSILHGDEIQFSLEWNPKIQTTLSVDLFAEAGNRVRQPELAFYFVQNQGIVISQQQGRRARSVQHRFRASRADVKLLLKNEDVDVFVNGARVFTRPLPRSVRLNKAIVLTVARLGNAAVLPNQEKAAADLLTIADFHVGRSQGGVRGLPVADESQELLLTLPRMHKKNPPSHVLVAQNGDLLRGRLVDITAERVLFASRLKEFAFPRDRLAGVVQLDAPDREDSPTAPPLERTTRVVLSTGAKISFVPNSVVEGRLLGSSEVLGECSVPIASIREILMGDRVTADRMPYANWVLRPAREPVFARADGTSDPSAPARFGVDSALVGTQAEDFELDLLDGGRFSLSDHSDKVVILDFWATWCGPCVRAMPGLIKSVEGLPSDEVMLVAVNQEETSKTVSEFLQARGWKLTVALDREGKVGQQFGVDAIPQTVVIGKGGNIELLHIGAHPNAGEELADAVRKILGKPPADPADADAVTRVDGPQNVVEASADEEQLASAKVQLPQHKVEEAAIAAITKLGGWVAKDDEGHVVEVNMVYHNFEDGRREDNDQITDAALDHVGQFPRLELLLLKQSQASDPGLEKVSKVTSLKRIYMWNATDVTDAGIAHLASLQNLEYLHCSESGITDAAFETFVQLPRLAGLSLQNNSFTDKALEHAGEMIQLQQLTMGLGNLQVTDKGVAYLTNLQQLERLGIQHSQITDVGLGYLKVLLKLKTLWISGANVTEAGLLDFRKALPNVNVSP